ncbi:MAG: polysaccharide biosynthesis/export family protein [Candidatus Azobacteroides sp.]|nr:polysaccharide biosynthesis/export family protein [Candidatus Azobacteroides sp.]
MKSKLYLYIIVFFGCMWAFSSCITKKQTTYLQRWPAHYSPVPQEEYRLRVDDEVSYFLMTTSNETQALYNGGTIPFRIFEDGTIHLPIGQIKIAGLTLREAERVVKNAFSRIAPDVEVRLTMANNYFYVQGDGGKGAFPIYKENLNIFQALALAGDISNLGDRKNIKLIRQGPDGYDHVKTVDLRQESIVESEFYYIMPNDVIYIPTRPNSFFNIDSMGSFISLVVTPLSFLTMVVTLFKLN